MPNRPSLALLAIAATSCFAETYKDSRSGVEILEIPALGQAPSNLYYHFSNFTAGNRNVIFADSVSGKAQIYRYDLLAKEVRQVTQGDGVAAATACPHPVDPNLLYYFRGPVVFELNLATSRERRVGEVPSPRAGGYQQPTFSHDLKSLAVTKQRDEANWEIGLIDIATGAYRTVITQGFRIGHVQHSPKEPVIFYVWETGGYAPQRTWLVNADGSANRPYYANTDPKLWPTPLKEWITHESWVPDTGGMTLIMDKVGIVLADSTGKGRILPGNYWHVRARQDGKFLVADDFDGNLWLIESATDNRRLIASGLRDGVRANHAHASFDRTGRYVLFNTGRTKQALALIDLKAAGLY
ncbi:MAG: hypothetical protein HZB13_11495 [Acidobacteria bacterium]|nr:hypothetical protein [Acidobacteriota bacterium]